MTRLAERSMAMDELIKMISEKLGISQEEARKAVLIMTDYLRSKLPPAMFGDVDTILETPNITEEEARELGLFKIP